MSLTYETCAKLLYDSLGRRMSKRRLARHTVLFKDGDCFIVRYWRTNILTFHPNGDCTIQSYNSVTTRNRLNSFILAGWGTFRDSSTYGDNTILHNHGEAVTVLSDRVTIHPDGTVSGGSSLEEAYADCKAERNMRARERYKLRYWILKARRGGKSRKALNPTIIQAELNVTIRTAMIKVYGIERFLQEIGATVVETVGGYQLLSYSLSAWNNIRALRMVCPSTKTVYIHPVSPDLDSVASALDWMFDTPNFRERVLSES